MFVWATVPPWKGGLGVLTGFMQRHSASGSRRCCGASVRLSTSDVERQTDVERRLMLKDVLPALFFPPILRSLFLYVHLLVLPSNPHSHERLPSIAMVVLFTRSWRLVTVRTTIPVYEAVG